MAFPRRSFVHAFLGWLVGVGVIAACTSACSSPLMQPSVDAGPTGVDAPVTDPDAATAADARVDGFVPSGKCADMFGSALTAGFGRIDGTIYAVQKPSDTTCTFSNADHVILQVLMNSAVYRLVVNVQSDRAGADPKIRIAVLHGAHARRGDHEARGRAEGRRSRVGLRDERRRPTRERTPHPSQRGRPGRRHHRFADHVAQVPALSLRQPDVLRAPRPTPAA